MKALLLFRFNSYMLSSILTVAFLTSIFNVHSSFYLDDSEQYTSFSVHNSPASSPQRRSHQIFGGSNPPETFEWYEEASSMLPSFEVSSSAIQPELSIESILSSLPPRYRSTMMDMQTQTRRNSLLLLSLSRRSHPANNETPSALSLSSLNLAHSLLPEASLGSQLPEHQHSPALQYSSKERPQTPCRALTTILLKRSASEPIKASL